jgi:hypothetical protein
MPLHDPFPTLEVGPFYCAYEDDRWDEPEIIVDPLSGFVVAILPPQDRSPRPRVSHQEQRPPSQWRSLWRETLSRWLRRGGATTTLARAYNIDAIADKAKPLPADGQTPSR